MIEHIYTYADIAIAIRQFRKRRGMTGGELGSRTQLSQSKISRFETGLGIPTKSEMDSIMHILAFPKTIQQQTLALMAGSVVNQKIRPRPMQPLSNEIFKREADSRHIRLFCPTGLPALLQTPASRIATLEYRYTDFEVLQQRLSESMQRQDLLWDKGRKFQFVIHETALYSQGIPKHDRLAQLDRLLRLCSLPQISLGIIPTEMGFPPIELPTFIIYNHDTLVLILGFKEITLKDPRDVVERIKIFATMDEGACHGREANELISKAMRYFSPQRAHRAE